MRGRLTRLEVWGVFAVVTLVVLGIGLRGRIVELAVNWDGLSAVAHANYVFRAGDNANLAMIGFVQPPLPALLQLPLVLLFPPLATTGFAANLLGAICAGVTAVLLLGLAADSGLPRAWRWPLVGVLVVHPMVLGPAASGAPMALLTALLLGGAWALLRWSQTEGLRDLIVASVLLSAALITRYETVFIVVGALIYLSWRTLRDDRSWSKLEGTLITFGLPIVYVGGIWIVANWAIMGDPWHFARMTFAGGGANPGAMLTQSLELSLAWFFPVLALVYNQMRGVGRRPARARPIAWLTLTAIVAPAIFSGVFGSLGPEGDWGRLVSVVSMTLAGGFAMLVVIIGDAVRGRGTSGPIHGTIAVGAASLGVCVWLFVSGSVPTGPGAGAWLGRGPLTDSAGVELQAASLLREMELPKQRRHLIAGWPGFAVALFSGRTGEIEVVRMEELEEYTDELWVGSRIVLLVGEEHGGVPEEAVLADLNLGRGLRLLPRWGAGPWECYEVTRR